MKGRDFIQNQLANLPSLPGIYQMIDASKTILYIGKAKNLKKRVSSYSKNDLSTRIQRMVFCVCDLKYVVTNSEAEALLLEAALIKKHKPKFNVLLKDDKSFPYIKLTTDSLWPQIMKFRGKKDSYDSLFGPFASSKQVDVAITQIQKIFKIRTCSDNYFKSRQRACLLYQIQKCSAPCVAKVNEQEYGNLVAGAIKFLSGKSKQLLSDLNKEMTDLSNNFEYEKAAVLRDRIKAVEYVLQKNSMNLVTLDNADVISICGHQGIACVQVFIYRGGQNLGTNSYFPTNSQDVEMKEVLMSFLGQFYQSKPPPSKILLNLDLGDETLVLEEALKALHKTKVKISTAQNKEQKTLMQMVEENAQIALQNRCNKAESIALRLAEIAEIFGIKSNIERIELYDNSHIMGQYAVGAMVVSGPNGFEKDQYRKFNIRTNTNSFGGDDYQMMREVLTRRLAKLSAENRPDLIIIDGGKGHLSVVKEVMACLGVDIPFVCMSKGPDRNKGRETFYIEGIEPFSLPNDNKTMQYLQLMRNQVHEFAIKSHRHKRNISQLPTK